MIHLRNDVFNLSYSSLKVSSPSPSEATLWQDPPSTPPTPSWRSSSILSPASRGRSVSAPGPRGTVIVNSFVRGPIVPQKRYKPHAMSDRKRYVEEIELKPTIYFKDSKDGQLIDGLPILLIMQNRISGLQGRDDSMLSDCGPSISVRISVSFSSPSSVWTTSDAHLGISGLAMPFGPGRSPPATSGHHRSL